MGACPRMLMQLISLNQLAKEASMTNILILGKNNAIVCQNLTVYFLKILLATHKKYQHSLHIFNPIALRTVKTP